MTPKEKASHLIRKYTLDFTMDFDQTRHCALIAVDEVIDAIVIINEYDFEPLNEYWNEVREHLINMRTGNYEAKVDRFNFGL